MSKLVNLIKIIEESFVKVVEEGYSKNKFWQSEFDIKGGFYRLLRPTIDEIPEYELYHEWFVRHYDGSSNRLDMALVEPFYSEKKNFKVVEGYVRIAMEFKWSDMKYKTEFQKRIRSDTINLSKMISEGTKSYEYKPEANIIRVNKGNKPYCAFMFTIDVTVEKEKIKEANEFYIELEKDYPEIKIIWAFPNEKKDKIFLA